MDDVDYCCIIKGIGKSKTINLLEHANLSEKNEFLWTIDY